MGSICPSLTFSVEMILRGQKLWGSWETTTARWNIIYKSCNNTSTYCDQLCSSCPSAFLSKKKKIKKRKEKWNKIHTGCIRCSLATETRQAVWFSFINLYLFFSFVVKEQWPSRSLVGVVGVHKRKLKGKWINLSGENK